jgi:glycine/D-amino acid oxidase-like deaminating enzyme
MTSPVQLVAPVNFPGPPPAETDVVVIGGGIIGVMTAYHLAGRGLRAMVLEKGRIAGEQSSRNWGWIRCQGRDPAELPIMVEASRDWAALAAETGAEALGFQRSGVLYLANSARDLARFEAWLPHATALGLDTRMLTRAEVRGLLPGHAADWPGGIWTASDGRAEPGRAVPALAWLAAAKGVRIVENCAVRRLDIAAGRVAGVATEVGRIACTSVVLAGGAWSSLFLRNEGIALPQLSVRATVAATAPLPEVFPGNAADAHFAFRRRLDGGYTLAPGHFHEVLIGPDAVRHFAKYLPQLRADPFGSRYLPASPKSYPDAWTTPRRWQADAASPFEACRVLDPRPHQASVERIAQAFGAAFPCLGEVRIAKAWAGMIDTMPDVVPVIDCAPVPGLTIATGMSGHGFGIGPGVGRVVADLVAGRATGHDLTRFRFSRFSDGSPIRLGGAL